MRLEALERDASVLFPGAAAAIRRAAAAVPLAIASGALRRRDPARARSRATWPRASPAIVAAEDTPASKPAPDPYLRAVALLRDGHRRHARRRRDCVAIEDSRWGLESARAAGLRTVAVTHTYDASALAGAADLVIDSLESLDLAALARLCSSVAIQPLGFSAAMRIFPNSFAFTTAISAGDTLQSRTVTALRTACEFGIFCTKALSFSRRTG